MVLDHIAVKYQEINHPSKLVETGFGGTRIGLNKDWINLDWVEQGLDESELG